MSAVAGSTAHPTGSSPEDERDVDRSLRPRRLDDFVGQTRSRTSWRSRSRPPPAAGEALDHVLLAGPPGPRQDLARADRRRRARRPVRPDRGTGAGAQGRRGRLPDRARAARGVLRRRDPPPAPRARGDVLSGDGGRLPADHRRPGRGRPGGDAATSAVHADRRDDARRPAHDAAPRPLRDPAPARALRARGSGHDRPPLGEPARGRDRGRRRGRAIAQRSRGTPRVANRLLQAGPRLRRGARERRGHRRGRGRGA